MIDTLNQRKTTPTVERSAAAPAMSNAERVKAVVATFGNAEAGNFSTGLRALRTSARTQVTEIGFPTPQHEEWRFTNMAPVLQLPLHPAAELNASITAKDIARFTFDLDCYRLVFIDGHFSAELSALPAAGGDLQVSQIKENTSPDLEKHLARHAHVEGNFFTALNSAFFQDGAYVSIAAGKTADKPVHLLYIGASEEPGATILNRSLVVAGRGAEVKVIESHVSLSDAPRLTSAVTELILDADARVEHCKVQQESERAFHVAFVQSVQAKGSRWTSHSIATGGRIARNQIQALFAASGAEAILNGLYFAHADQLIDHHTVVDHAQSRCESHEFYHGILADRSHGVFNGKIFVRKDAQKTNAKQTNRNLLLSDNAVIDTKPQLEIFADDVKCTHGATVGQLSDEALFYLQSRGIGVENARRMLVQAFASDVVERIGIAPVRAQLEEMLVKRFAPAQG